MKKGIIITIVVVAVGFIWLALTAIPGAPLSSLSVGFGLTEALQGQQIGGGYNMNQLVLFIIFAVIIVVLGAIFMRKDKEQS
jgi:membrane protein implicated in regulation of membrane protease activity